MLWIILIILLIAIAFPEKRNTCWGCLKMILWFYIILIILGILTGLVWYIIILNE